MNVDIKINGDGTVSAVVELKKARETINHYPREDAIIELKHMIGRVMDQQKTMTSKINAQVRDLEVGDVIVGAKIYGNDIRDYRVRLCQVCKKLGIKVQTRRSSPDNVLMVKRIE